MLFNNPPQKYTYLVNKRSKLKAPYLLKEKRYRKETQEFHMAIKASVHVNLEKEKVNLTRG